MPAQQDVPEWTPEALQEAPAPQNVPDDIIQYNTPPADMQRMEEAYEPIPATEEYQYINRELSWLAFNRRVLAEAVNPDNPLLERVRFLSITADNLDEFFMVRVASLRRKMLRGDERTDPAGLTPQQQLERVIEDAYLLMQEQEAVRSGHILPDLEAAGIKIWPVAEMSAQQLDWMEQQFHEEVMPRMIPYVHTEGGPFVHVAGRALQFGLLVQLPGQREQTIATMQAPVNLPRMWRFPEHLPEGFFMLEDMMTRYASRLMPDGEVLGCWPYRVTRDEDYTVPEDSEVVDILSETRKSLRRRKTGAIVRLEVDAQAPAAFLGALCDVLEARTEAVYRLAGPLDLTFLADTLRHLPSLASYRYAPFASKIPTRLAAHENVFAALKEGDIFLHHPYDSFDTVLQFIREGATDARVLAIHTTLYRLSSNSPVVKALCDAAEAGKRVSVLLELKARFDEENNIHWAEVLGRAGCEVIYGMPQLKTHSKITLIVRRENGGLRRYVHLGTGNYNDVTARMYTDMGLLTCDPALGDDAQAFFNMITGFSKEPAMKKLVYAPRMLRRTLTELIEREIGHAYGGKPCGIVAKMNSLVDPDIIRLLYEASRAGVSVRLIVRGVCCLHAGVPGLSDRIEVKSIVGRFLEHSRVFRFENGGDAQFYLSSADWMPRNLNRRIELMFPVEDEQVRARVQEVLDTQWQDTAKAWRMTSDGRYERMPRGSHPLNAQEWLLHEEVPGEVFMPEAEVVPELSPKREKTLIEKLVDKGGIVDHPSYKPEP